MEKGKFRYIFWCDLKIVLLKIYSYEEWDKEMVLTCNKPDMSKPVVNVYICKENETVFDNPQLYREKCMFEGMYLGHHFGSPAKLRILDENNIAFYHQTPGKIIWCFIIKYVLSVFANKNNMLHVKGGAIEYKGKAFIIMGRGGAGKTEMVNTLCCNGAHFMANTHLLVDDKNVYGIKSNIRIRRNGCDVYVPINAIHTVDACENSKPIGGVFWVNYRTDNVITIKKISKKVAMYNLLYFSESIINWEMKEDIADYCHSDPFAFAGYINKNKVLIENFCNNYNLYYLNLDIFSDQGLKETIDFMEKFV